MNGRHCISFSTVTSYVQLLTTHIYCVIMCGQLRSRAVLDSRCHLALQVEIYCTIKNVKKVTVLLVILLKR